MIRVYVNLGDIPEDWLAKADVLTKLLIDCKDDGEDVAAETRQTAAEKRNQIIDDNKTFWGQLKPILLNWSHNKCWYSELRDDGSDYHVDHFRPKGRVRDEGVPDRDGYWWLAFTWWNYRASVAWVNSLHGSEEGPARGKADHFPVAPGTPVACGPDDDISIENPIILDPVNDADVILMDFDETGLPVPATDGWGAKRVMITRNLLHLDSPRMLEARQKVWRDCEHMLFMAATAMEVPEGEYRPRDAVTASQAVEVLCRMLRPDSPLSAVAHACILKCKYQWARRLPNHRLSQLPTGPLGAASDK